MCAPTIHFRSFCISHKFPGTPCQSWECHSQLHRKTHATGAGPRVTRVALSAKDLLRTLLATSGRTNGVKRSRISGKGIGQSWPAQGRRWRDSPLASQTCKPKISRPYSILAASILLSLHPAHVNSDAFQIHTALSP